jgi:hypothetical protein
MEKVLALLAIILATYLYFSTRTTPAPKPVEPAPHEAVSEAAPPPVVNEPPTAPAVETMQMVAPPKRRVVKQKSESKKLALPYKIVNGMFIVQGDLMAGAVIPGETPPEDGLVELEALRLWPNVIPFHIQPDVPNKERVLEALKMFDGTNVQFVPENGDKDVLVFEQGGKNCFSYLGKVTEKQQIFISPECKPADIAHEILHALGFTHEQNRADRDDYIVVHKDNIEDEFMNNFEKLPHDYMKVSGLAEFDFRSLMLYPPWMFAKGGRETMEPKLRDRQIDPQPGLSAGDIERLNRAYKR